MTNLSMRIVDASYYMEKPLQNVDILYSEFRNCHISHIPVIRIFGTTTQGQKACLHVHCVFPYFYVALPGNVDNIHSFLKQFAMSLDLSLTTALGKSVSNQQQYVYDVQLVQKIPFYGYYQEERDFLQVFLYNPALVQKASDLLVSGSVLNQFFQPYETHIPYMLQFFIDHNLHGMNLVHLKKVYFRKPLPKACDFVNSMNASLNTSSFSFGSQMHNNSIFNDDTVPEHLCSQLEKRSTCSLEFDVKSHDILNINNIKESIGLNPGLNALWEDEKQRRRENLENSMIDIQESQDRQVTRTLDEEKSLKDIMATLEDRAKQANVPANSWLSSNEGDIQSSGSNLDLSAHLSSSIDGRLLDVLVDIADEEQPTNTPLSDATFIDNGLEEPGEETEEEDAESLLMTQSVSAIIQQDSHLNQSGLLNDDDDDDDDDTWSESFLGHIPQLDGATDFSEDSVTSVTTRKGSCKKLKEKKMMASSPSGFSSCITDTYNPRKSYPQRAKMSPLKFASSYCSSVCRPKQVKSSERTLRTQTSQSKCRNSNIRKCRVVLTDIIKMKKERGSFNELDDTKVTVIEESPMIIEESPEDMIISDSCDENDDKTLEDSMTLEGLLDVMPSSSQQNVSAPEYLYSGDLLSCTSEMHQPSTPENKVTPRYLGTIFEGYSPLKQHRLTLSNEICTRSKTPKRRISLTRHQLKIECTPVINLEENIIFSSPEDHDVAFQTPKKNVSEEKSYIQCKGDVAGKNMLSIQENIPKETINKDLLNNFQTNSSSTPGLMMVDDSRIVLKPLSKAPTYKEVLATLGKSSLSEEKNQYAFFSNKQDAVSGLTGVYTGQEVVTGHPTVEHLPVFKGAIFEGSLESMQQKQLKALQLSWMKQNNIDVLSHTSKTKLIETFSEDKMIAITPCMAPPTLCSVTRWLKDEREKLMLNSASTHIQLDERHVTTESSESLSHVEKLKNTKKNKRLNCSDIEGLTPNNTYNFQTTHQNVMEAKAVHVCQHLTTISVELHVSTRRSLRPDPYIDSIAAIFYCVSKDDCEDLITGMFMHDPVKDVERTCVVGISEIQIFESELAMIEAFAGYINLLDPEIIVGYEVQMLSLGYLIERGAVLDLNVCQLLSRMKEKTKGKENHNENWFGQLISMEITGRIIVNVWRVMRSEVTLQQYSYENVSYHVLHERVPSYSFSSLTSWWSSEYLRWRVCKHYLHRCTGNIRFLQHIDFINRTSELARIFGILFYSVISRGSQYRVESMMLRIAKPMNYIPVSPNAQQRALMQAPECIQLVLEPESRFYVDPVIVLDFQSLYPSIIIAYNYCFSTCLGRVKNFTRNENFDFGAVSMNLPFEVVKKLASDDDIHVTPNGVGFVKTNVRKGILPRMLEEILSTRLMVKASMKKSKHDKVLYKMMDSRQLGLKLIANVTYGYTAANYSGRMPCVEIGDSVVRKGRETLERAIHLVNNTKKWNAKVVYGDTDSLFVLVKGASKERAFAISKEIIDEVTASNPKPVKLKFEKIYQPCVLIAKKRYVGYMYESADQKEPIFEAKGIETVRRDNCPAVGKVLEKSIRVLFETKDVSLVKKYVQRQFVKMMEGSVILQDCVFAKEYRGMGNYKPGACVPALTLTRKFLKQDRRSEPRIGERVPYVIVHGSPGLPLIQLVRTPLEVVESSHLRVNSLYYITKQLCPPLGRIFSLLGVDVMKWFTVLPRISRVNVREQTSSKKGVISQYFCSSHCFVCGELTNRRVCLQCRSQSQYAVWILSDKLRNLDRRLFNFTSICQHCTGSREMNSACVSLDCPVFYKINNVRKELQSTNQIRDILLEF